MSRKLILIPLLFIVFSSCFAQTVTNKPAAVASTEKKVFRYTILTTSIKKM